MVKKKKRVPKKRNPVAQALHSSIFHKKIRRGKKRVDKNDKPDYALSNEQDEK
jgi:hypothetical protein